MSKKISGNIFYLKTALFILIYLLQITAVFSILGTFAVLSNSYALIGSLLSGGALILVSHKLPDIPQEPFTCGENFSERLLSYLLLFMLAMISLKTTSIASTDAFLYHLFYPEMWISAGRIYPVPLTGLPHEYFPIAGETMYGWLMLPGNMQPYYTLLQPLALMMALLATAGMWQMLKLPQLFIKSGILLFAAAGIIAENAAITYTDVLTGAFSSVGIAFMIIAFASFDDMRVKSEVMAFFAGTALGLSAAIKYSGLIMAPIMGFVMLMIFFISDIKTERAAANKVKYIIFILSAFFPAALFYLPNWIRTGNPFYPVKIPFLFANGVDFERPPVEWANLWNFYVNKNIWDMNIFSAVFSLLMIFLIIVLVLNSLLRKSSCSVCRVLGVVITAALAGETVMLLIYPAMTGARQIIPFLSAVSMLFPGVLYLTVKNFTGGKKAACIFIITVILIGFLTVKNGHNPISLTAIISSIVFSVILASFRTRRAQHTINITGALIFVLVMHVFSFTLRSQTVYFAERFTGSSNGKIIKYFHDQYNKSDKGMHIAVCGYLFNYMLLQDMPLNRVFTVPINLANTVHLHEVEKFEDLREKNINFDLWLERLKAAGIKYLLIDLGSHQDFPSNRKAELNWAKDHPQIFEEIVAENDLYLFKINF